jgi:hypothetical protein
VVSLGTAHKCETKIRLQRKYVLHLCAVCREATHCWPTFCNLGLAHLSLIAKKLQTSWISNCNLQSAICTIWNLAQQISPVCPSRQIGFLCNMIYASLLIAASVLSCSAYLQPAGKVSVQRLQAERGPADYKEFDNFNLNNPVPSR